jgi:hypothetical protein
LVSSPQAKKFFPARRIFAKGKNAAGSINQQKKTLNLTALPFSPRPLKNAFGIF